MASDRDGGEDINQGIESFPRLKVRRIHPWERVFARHRCHEAQGIITRAACAVVD